MSWGGAGIFLQQALLFPVVRAVYPLSSYDRRKERMHTTLNRYRTSLHIGGGLCHRGSAPLECGVESRPPLFSLAEKMNNDGGSEKINAFK